MAHPLRIENEDDVPSPALLIYPDRVDENIRRMVKIAGGPQRLRPHVKTHKLPQIVAAMLAQGIRKFKAATIAEAEMCAQAGAPDVLVAYQLVGPNVQRLTALAAKYPHCRFSCLADDPDVVDSVGAAAVSKAVAIGVLVDLDIGTRRTGIAPGAGAAELYHRIARTRGLGLGGLHVFDGHLRGEDLSALTRTVDLAYAPVWHLRDALIAEGLPVPSIVAGGTPTFPILAQRSDVELGAGTCVFWDLNSAEHCPYLDFLQAACVLTRVISRPGDGLLCLDLGHKAIASEMPHPRVTLIGLEEARFVRHNEEHLVAEIPSAREFGLGAVFYGIPRHICPTVALYSEAVVVRGGRATEHWPIAARGRKLSL